MNSRRAFTNLEEERIDNHYKSSLDSFYMLLEPHCVEKFKHTFLIFRDFYMWKFACLTAYRRTEILSIKVGDVFDFVNEKPKSIITIQGKFLKKKRKAINIGKKLDDLLRAVKGEKIEEEKYILSEISKSRSCPLKPELRDMLEIYMFYFPSVYNRECLEDEYLFQAIHPKSKQMNLSTFNRIIDRLLYRCGFNDEEVKRLGPHSTRKTFADRYYKHSNNDILKTSKMMGHSSTIVTQRYLDSNIRIIENDSFFA